MFYPESRTLLPRPEYNEIFLLLDASNVPRFLKYATHLVFYAFVELTHSDLLLPEDPAIGSVRIEKTGVFQRIFTLLEPACRFSPRHPARISGNYSFPSCRRHNNSASVDETTTKEYSSVVCL